jgi:hypothetical protein
MRQQTAPIWAVAGLEIGGTGRVFGGNASASIGDFDGLLLDQA